MDRDRVTDQPAGGPVVAGGFESGGAAVAGAPVVDEVDQPTGSAVVEQGGVEATGVQRYRIRPGAVDERERWGRDVVHCPYCHGWEVRDRAIGVLATGPMSVHQALLFRQWSADITYLTHTGAPPTEEEAERLAARDIRVVTGEVTAVAVAGDRLTGVRLVGGTTVGCEVLVVASRMVARTGFLTSLGLSAVPHPLGFGEYVPADPTGRTDVPGVWVAGNVTDLAAQVGAAAAAGTIAGAAVNADLTEEETRLAVEARRSRVGV